MSHLRSVLESLGSGKQPFSCVHRQRIPLCHGGRVLAKDQSFKGQAAQNVNSIEGSTLSLYDIPANPLGEQILESQADRIQNALYVAAGEAMKQHASIVQLTNGQARAPVVVSWASAYPATVTSLAHEIQAGQESIRTHD
ncbi:MULTISPECIES: hypothetical protein [unclassified Massilia]|uniref:hypothetical protein n=1 Tax=unclassified Massilia TaxID=2609279 RepID=UPI0012E34398|nr:MULTISPECIES: hypothetical protein [unclassified Massilia]